MEEQVSHVLYIATSCRVCHALRAKGIPRSVRVENVIDIIPRPAWLDGTPTLVDVNVGVLYKGSDALIVLDHMRQSQAQQQQAQQQVQQPAQPPPQRNALPQYQPRAPPPQPSQPQSQPQSQPKPLNEMRSKPGSGSKIDWDALFKPPSEDQPTDDKPAGNVVQDSLADLISRRAMQTPPPQPVR